jgi:hypothetical protein
MKWYWPELTGLQESEQAAHYGAGVCFFIAGVTTIVAGLSVALAKPILGLNAWSFVDAGLFAIAGWRVWRFSKTWAVLALILYVVERGYALVSSPVPAGLIMTVIFTLALIGSVRGTFAYHAFKRKESTASLSATAGGSL